MLSFSSRLLVLIALAFVASAPAQSALVTDLGPGCGGPAPILTATPPVPGNPVQFVVDTEFPNAHTWIFVSIGAPAPLPIFGLPCTVYVDLFNPSNFIQLVDSYTDAGGRLEFTIDIPNDPMLAGVQITAQARVWAAGGPIDGDHLSNGLRLTLGDSDPCLLIIDEDGIDNGMSTIEAAARRRGVTDAFLVNDDRPTEIGNPWLRWNTMYPGDVVLLPTGRVDDEGYFALPPNAPFNVSDFAEGLVPQHQLDPIPDVMPLRNPELRALVGRTCVAVVYDSDISINYVPLMGNLQGERLGRFAFTVLEVVLPGTLPESGSSESLVDLLVRVEGPMAGGFGFPIPLRDHEPDSIQLDEARWSMGQLTVVAGSNFAPSAVMTVSVDGILTEATMTFDSRRGRYVGVFDIATDIRGRRITLTTDEGGAYNDFVL